METKRLKLIPACLERAEEAHQAVVRSQKTLEVYLPWVPHVLTLEAMIEGTEKAIANFENFEEELRYYIIEKESDRLLGAVGLMIRDPDVPSFEIGYWLDDAAVMLPRLCSQLSAMRLMIWVPRESQFMLIAPTKRAVL